MAKRILILGAAGRDFHNFNLRFREDPDYEVVAFTAAQIPNIAGRTYPPELAGPRYPHGVPILPEDNLENLIERERVEQVVFSYSDVSHIEVMHVAARVLASGADFLLLGTEATMLKAQVPVVSVCAVRTGAGKSPVSRHVSRVLKELGWRLVVVRHPMPYGELLRQRAQRFATHEDLDRHECTIEEREEYEPHLARGTVVYAGIDYEALLRQAEQEADLILWDGGNNDTPFFCSDLEIVVADPHRAGHELTYFPGEVNLLRADVVVINKVDTAPAEAVETVRRNVRQRNPEATIVETACVVSVPAPEQIKGKAVLVVEDGPTITHGEMAYGAATVAARQFGARTIVDPRPYAVGSIAEAYRRYPHLGAELPAMGYGQEQMRELRTTIERTPCDLVLIATPVDLARLLHLTVPFLRVTYDVEERTQPSLLDLLRRFSDQQRARIKSGQVVIA
ncbi:MAG: cyclic 2,3-diphosphoglycerate synthase [Terriglobia bacterium]